MATTFSTLLQRGASCTVVSTVLDTSFTQSKHGVCYSSLVCWKNGGVAIGRCGLADVCCAFPRTCGQTTYVNQTYFVNPGHPSYFNATNSCQLTVNRVRNTKLSNSPASQLCQLRLDFIDFELNQPSYGNCESDQFVVSGQNSNSIVPTLCGRNTGQHMFMDIEDTNGPYILRVITRGTGNRRWNIRITLIECGNNALRAPMNCLQYFTGPNGQFESFNYVDSNQLQVDASAIEETNAYTYLNNMDYAICFRKEAGFCTQTYTVNSSYTPFALINIAPNGSPLFDTSTAGTGLLKCPFDFLLLSGVRFCGSHLNPYAVNESPNNDAAVTDISSGPFIARFKSNNAIAGRGFRVNYQQNPCNSVNSVNNLLPPNA